MSTPPAAPSISGPPPLTPWQSTWRYLAAVAISTAAFIGPAAILWDENRLWLAGDLALGVASLALMPLRRRHPVAIATVLTLFSAVSSTAAGPGVVAFVSMATHRQWRQIIPIGLLSFAAGVVYGVITPDETAWYVNVTFSAVFVGIFTATGMYVGARRELVATLQDRAERAEREQALRVEQAQGHERARIAREMHDVLAHRMSLVAMHAGALAYRTDLGPEDTRRAAEVIQANAHRALIDLREVLGLLRGGADGQGPSTPERPQPTLRDVPELVAEARAAGMTVTLSDEVRDVDRAPETVGRHAYRMIQEGLTNARRHAPDTPVEVRLSGAPHEGIRLEVRNPLRLGMRTAAPGSGLGLVGLAERATLSGGRLEHETTGEGQFVVRAWLPWPA